MNQKSDRSGAFPSRLIAVAAAVLRWLELFEAGLYVIAMAAAAVLAAGWITRGKPVIHAQTLAETSAPTAEETLAAAPPLGWNEWDSYGLTVTEADFRANAAILAKLRQYGWQYAVFDAGWYMRDPASATDRGYVWDKNGRLIPADNRFPSSANGAGFLPLAEWLHARGLKLGIHVMPGIPRQAVAGNLPIAGSAYHAADAADTTQTCPWDKEFYVARDNAAGQAWYDSIARQYAAWGVDFIKLGCVSDQPFPAAAIRQISDALRKTGRPIVLSLSPGPPPANEVPLMQRDSQMWRISPEHWDVWNTPPGKDFPVGLHQDFDLLAQWSRFAKPGSWIDPDALADGWLAPHPAYGRARHSQLTPDEERSEFTLWCFARAPLIEGANLTRLDALTRELMTNRQLLNIDQHARESHPVLQLPAGWEQVRVWEAETDFRGHTRHSFAFFNLQDHPVTLRASWPELRAGSESRSDGTSASAPDRLELRLAAHGSAILEAPGAQ